MSVIERRILRINDDPDNINSGQICILPSNDADLGFRALCHRDHGGTTHVNLAKDEIAKVRDVRMGSNISANAAANRFVAICDNSGSTLSLGASASDFVAIGSGSIGDFDGFACIFNSSIGNQIGSHVNDSISKGLIVGSSINADGDFPIISGYNVDHDAHFGSSHGLDIENAFDYARVHGRYAKAFWEGATFTARDRYNSVTGNCQTVKNWTLVAESSGNETVTLRPTFGGSDRSFYLPDGFMAGLRVEVFSAIYGTDDAANGIKWSSRRFLAWNNAGYFPVSVSNLDQENILTKTATFGIELSAQSLATNGEFNLNIIVTSASGLTITHVATVEAIISQCSLIASS